MDEETKTKREIFAALIAVAICTRSAVQGHSVEEVALIAVAQADALLKELAK